MSDEGRLIADRYRILNRVGRGGMATVWRAHDGLLDRQVAVKKLHQQPDLDAEELAARFERTRREARSAARISHPNVVVVHDVVDDEGLPVIVMEYVPSRTLGDLIRAHGPVSPEEAARIGRGVIAALRAAHRVGILHRDVKPANVLLAEDGRVVLTDFGIAKATEASALTRTGQLAGSIDYMAPERLGGAKAGPESDLWSLGATLFQAVEGRSPFLRESPAQTMYAIAMEPAPEVRGAGPLTALIQGLLTSDPADRMSAEEAERLLRAVDADPERTRLVHPVTPAAASTVVDAAAAKPEPDSAHGTREETAAASAAESTQPATTGPEAPPPSDRTNRSKKLIALAAVVATAALVVTMVLVNAMTENGATGPDSRSLVVAASKKCLSRGSGAEKIQLFQASCDGSPAQQWHMESDGSIRSSGKCMTVAGETIAGLTRIQLAECSGAANQRFHLSGTALMADKSRKCVDIYGGAGGTGAVLWECNGRDNQTWTIRNPGTGSPS
ncbi:serine/threonine protein kinase [Streptomyces sp. NPDC127072]|uniref:serine/threonine protein kinase n=1 Tax=Streptomyces sp. NPDC127072 TaxID=3347129 RepID=UPI00364D3FC5